MGKAKSGAPEDRFTPKVLPSVAKIDHLQVHPPTFMRSEIPNGTGDSRETAAAAPEAAEKRQRIALFTK
jgi:hypothetical protein